MKKALLAAAAAMLPVGVVAATAGPALAGGVSDPTGAPATASCSSAGGSISFKVPIGIATSGGYVYPIKNKGNQIKIVGVTLTCTSSVVSGSFTGVASGKIKTTDPDDLSTTNTADPKTFYSCTGLLGVSPSSSDPDSTLAGTLKIKWTTPAGQKFAGGKKSVVAITSILGGVNGSGQGTFTIPGHPGTGSIVGSFPGSDAGASSTSTDATASTEGALAAQCSAAGGVSTINLGSGTSTLQ